MRGSTRSLAIPYSRRLAIIMLISALLATANMVMKAKIHSGNADAPASTTFSSGASPTPSSAGATRATDEMDTST